MNPMVWYYVMVARGAKVDKTPDYKIRKVDGKWLLQFRDNQPIPHHSFNGALGGLWDLTRLSAHRRNPIGAR